MEIQLEGQKFILTNQRVMFWVSKKILILSDLHIGKTGHFRKHGIPISDQVLYNDLIRLEAVINKFKPDQILIVGDLFHASKNANFKEFKNWLGFYGHIKWILIKGNHDIHSDGFYQAFGLETHKEYILNKIKFIHEPAINSQDFLHISGHVHPGIKLRLKGKQYIKLPCYQQFENQFILPAFSLFTGLYNKSPAEETTYYPFTEQEIWEIKKADIKK